jgi:hypothetical protein
MPYKVDADGRDVALGVCVILRHEARFKKMTKIHKTIRRGQDLGTCTHRKPKQQAGLPHARVSNEQELQQRRHPVRRCVKRKLCESKQRSPRRGLLTLKR